jgi:hypothetical protein
LSALCFAIAKKPCQAKALLFTSRGSGGEHGRNKAVSRLFSDIDSSGEKKTQQKQYINLYAEKLGKGERPLDSRAWAGLAKAVVNRVIHMIRG